MRRINVFIGLAAVLGALFFYKKHFNKIQSNEKVLNLSMISAPVSLDPVVAADCLYSCMELSKVYEGLYEYHYTKRPAEIVPNLAESMPIVSADGLEYTIKIKQGVKFQDNKCFADGKGREVTAEDFVYSFKRVADSKNSCSLFSLLDGLIQGLSEWREKLSAGVVDYSTEIEGIQAMDKYTIKIKLTKQLPLIINYLTMPFTFVVPKEAVDYYKSEFGNHPVGTGPFIIDEYLPQENKIISIKNPTYREKYFPTEFAEECKHMADYAGKKLPFLDKVETHIISEEQPKWLKFMSKSMDIINMRKMTDIKSKLHNGEAVEELQKKGIRACIKPEASTQCIVFNCNAAPFKNNVALRRAMSLAYDRAKDAKLLCDDTVYVAKGFLPPILKGYDDKIDNKYVDYKLEEAKKLMIEAGYPGGKGLEPIVLDITGTVAEKNRAELFQKCMAELGIDIVVSVNSWAELTRKHMEGKTQMHCFAWSADFPDASNFLELCYKGLPNHPSWGSYNNEIYNRLYEQAIALPDSPEKEELYKKLNQILAYDVPIIFLYHTNSIHMHYEWVKNFNFFVGNTCNYIQYLDVDMNKKAEMTK